MILSPQIKQRDIDGQNLSLFLGINPYKLSDLFPFLKGLAFTYKRIITKGKEERARGRDVYTKKEEGRGKVILTSNNGVEANTLLVLILSIQSRSNSSTESGLTFLYTDIIMLFCNITARFNSFTDENFYLYLHSQSVGTYILPTGSQTETVHRENPRQ